MNNFQKSEQKGRQLFQSFLDQKGGKGQPTIDEFDRVDYYFTLKDKKAVAEIKVRNTFYSDYMIETDKYNALLKRKKDNNLDGAVYVCFYENSMYIFQTSTIKKYGTRQWKWCKRTTAEDNGYCRKDVILVPTDKAIRFDLINGKWEKQ